MKLHDLRPPDGSHKARTRVGRGIAAGKGKTAGRGTKGQKARSGGSIPPWFEGGQTPLHMRIPKLRGFKNRFKVDYEVVNVGDIEARIAAGAFAAAGSAPKKGEQLTINADILRAVGLVRNIKKPLKILGNGELSTALFVVADAFTKSASEKISAAGGAVNVLEVPTESRAALGIDGNEASAEASPRVAKATPKTSAKAAANTDGETAEPTPKTRKPRATATPAAAAVPAAERGPAVEGDDVAETVAETAADEPADSPDAVADATDEPPVQGDAATPDRATADGDESA